MPKVCQKVRSIRSNRQEPFVWQLLLLPIGVRARETHRGGIVYGPKAAFRIDAPEGWALDNRMPCVLYHKGESWTDAKIVRYAKIASTEFEDVNEFVAWAIKGMKAKHGMPKEKIASGKTLRRLTAT